MMLLLILLAGLTDDATSKEKGSREISPRIDIVSKGLARVEEYPVTGVGWSNFHVPPEMNKALRKRFTHFPDVIGHRHTVEELKAACNRHLQVFDEECKRYGFDARFHCVWNVDIERQQVSLGYCYDEALKEYRRFLINGQRPTSQERRDLMQKRRKLLSRLPDPTLKDERRGKIQRE